MESYLLFIGFIIGVVVTAAIWIGITVSKARNEKKKQEQRNEAISSIEQLCSVVEHAFASVSVDKSRQGVFRDTVLPKLEEINRELRTNMAVVDAFFIKYIESFLEYRYALLKQPGIAAADNYAPQPGQDVKQQESASALAESVVKEPTGQPQAQSAIGMDEEQVADTSYDISEDIEDVAEISVQASEQEEQVDEQRPAEEFTIEDTAAADSQISEEVAPEQFASDQVEPDEFSLEEAAEKETQGEAISEDFISEEVSEEITFQQAAANDEASQVQHPNPSEEVEAAFKRIDEEDQQDDEDLFLGDIEGQEEPSWQEEFNKVISGDDDSEDDTQESVEKINLGQPDNQMSDSDIIARDESEEEDAFEVANTQLYSQDMFSKTPSDTDDGIEQPFNGLEDGTDKQDLGDAEGAYSDDEALFFGEEEQDEEMTNDPKRATFEMESADFLSEDEAEQNASEKARSSDDQDDSFVTGDDVMKKMDNFFGFDK
ncbi:MAG: hypothetical protein ACOC4C_03815 [Fibrobacterota bacterium]